MNIKKSLLFVLMICFLSCFSSLSYANSAAELNQEIQLALKKLYKSTPVSVELAKTAKAILVFPDVLKGGFIVGAQYGEGGLVKNNKVTRYYNTVAASYGLQAGAQSFGYAMFLMTDSAYEYLQKSSGWEIGVGPSIVVVDEGVARTLTTTTAKDDVYAFIFDQEGLMAGLGIQGSKISPINPE